MALPRQVLRALDLQPGDYVAFELAGMVVQVRKAWFSLERPRPERVAPDRPRRIE